MLAPLNAVALLALAVRAVYAVLEMIDERNADRRAFGGDAALTSPEKVILGSHD